MKRFVEGQDRSQLLLLPDCLDDYVGEDNPVRIVDAFIDELDLVVLGFAGVIPEATGRPAYHPSTLQDFIYDAEHDDYTCAAGAKLTKARRRADHTEDFDFYRHLSACFTCPLRSRCTPTKLRRIKRWEHEDVLDRMQDRLDRMPEAMDVRRQTVEHPFGTLKAWMGATHFLTRTLDKVRTEMSLHVLAYNLKRMITIFGVEPLMAAIRT